MMLANFKIQYEQTMFSWESDRQGVSLHLTQHGSSKLEAIPTLYLFKKFTQTDILLKADWLTAPAGKFKLPFSLSFVMYNRMGDNLLIKTENNLSQGGSSASYFGYSYSPNLHIGVALKQLPKKEGLRESGGFLDKAYAAGFELHYQH